VFVTEKLGTAIWWGLNLHVNVTNLESDEKGEMYEEELLQAESDHDGTAEEEEQTPASANNKLKSKINLLQHL